jgi:hypothetical protein
MIYNLTVSKKIYLIKDYVSKEKQMIRLVFLFLILLPFQSFSAQNEYKIYKVIEIKKDELNNAITSIPIFGDLLKKDEIKKLETELKKIKEENKSQINNKKIIIEKLKIQLKNLNEKLIEESKPFYKKLIPKKE